ncbi:MAG: hypothetical protein V4695_08580 [Pseudomonadota bacterium]
MKFITKSAAKFVAIFALFAILGLTFLAYLRPDFALDLANRIMLCF